MPFYPLKVQARFESRQNTGVVTQANAGGRSASFQCGSFVRFDLRIDPATKTVDAAGFRTSGCGYMIAAADALTEIVRGRQLGDLHGLNRDELSVRIDADLGNLPVDRHQCVDVTIEALRAAFADFREKQIEEFSGEKALICTCFGVSEQTIERVIAQHKSPVSVEQVTKSCNAGGGCGSCRMLIQEMVDQVGGPG